MNSFPPVSAMCLTYGRPHLLEEAIHSFLIQDYPGPKELVVLNDFADQTLVCDHAEVRIVNTSERFPSVGEKRNACAAIAKHDVLFVWDDDDIFLPWRISLSIRRMNADRGYYKSPKAWILSNGGLYGPSANLFHSGSCFTRGLFERTDGYPPIGFGEDWSLEEAFQRLIPSKKNDDELTPRQLYYIYRWEGTDSYHLSAFGRDEGQAVTGNQKVAEFVAWQVREGRIPTGEVRLQPAWKSDYLTLVRSHLQQSATPELDEVDATSPPPPLVSCVMPTYGRPDYVAESIAMFLAQDYPAKELIILNDCAGQTLLGDFPDVRIFNCESRWPTLGEKRNAAIERAQGKYIAVWDDDDVYMPWRLSYSMRRIDELNAPLYCPAEYWAYWGGEDLHDNQAVLEWIYHPLVIFDI
ncbi:MAG: glycosyltransferase family 2 protein, partial [Planctomycetia bacterium]